MKRVLLVFLALLIVTSFAVAEGPALKITGSTGGTVYHDDKSAGVLDADQDVTLAYGPLSLALNAGYTYTFAATVSHVISFGYTLSASQPVGPFTFGGSLASSSLAKTIGGAFAGDWLGDIKATAAWKKDILSANLYSLFSAKKDYPFFMGVDLSGTVAPKWGSFTLGASFLDAKADADDVGYSTAITSVEGLSFYAKAKVSY